MHIEFSEDFNAGDDIKLIITSFISYFCKKYFHPRTRKILEIFIHYDKDSNMNGYCEWNIEYIRPRSFTIHLDICRNLGEIIETLAHEMLHVRQFVLEKLKHRFIPVKKILWDNQEIDVDKIEYMDYPWEQEAFKLQYDEAYEFCLKFKDGHI